MRSVVTEHEQPKAGTTLHGSCDAVLIRPHVAQIRSAGGKKAHEFRYIEAFFLCGNEMDMNERAVQADRLDIPWRCESDIMENADCAACTVFNKALNHVSGAAPGLLLLDATRLRWKMLLTFPVAAYLPGLLAKSCARRQTGKKT